MPQTNHPDKPTDHKAHPSPLQTTGDTGLRSDEKPGGKSARLVGADADTSGAFKLSEDWELDEVFLGAVAKQSKAVDAVSFDIFDTVLTRTFDSPIDLFAAVEQELLNDFPDEAEDFAALREQAEALARKQAYSEYGAEEITFEDIYTHLRLIGSGFSEDMLSHAKILELQIELESLVGVPDMLALVKRLRDLDVPYIFVSDMYLPSEFLARVLRSQGFSDWTALYVSSESKVTKATGAIWDLIKTNHGNVLHIGDDAWSDVASPKKFGLSAMHYTRVKSARRTGAKLNPYLLAYSKAQRTLVLEEAKQSAEAEQSVSQFYKIGQVFGTLIVGSYVKWLAERVECHGIDRLYFCARDGWLIQKAWSASGLDKKTGIEGRYLYVSRRPLNLASGFLESSPQKLSNSLMSFLSFSDGKISVGQALGRLDPSADVELASAARKRFGSLDVLLDGDESRKAFEALLAENSNIVFEILAEQYRVTVAYLNQENVFAAGRVSFVDMGWHASLQKSLRRIASNEGALGQVNIFGMYYGLWPAALGNRFAAGYMEAPFGNEFVPIEDQAALHHAVDILEELHTAPHGTVRSYHREHENWAPVVASSEAEQQQHSDCVEPFQKGVIDGITRVFEDGNHLGLKQRDLRIENANAALSALILSPTEEEVGALSTLKHSTTFDHSILSPIIPKICPEVHEARVSQILASPWPVGLLKHWMRAGQLRSEDARGMLMEHYGHLDERVMRQF